MVLRKKDVYIVITPIPGFIPRQLAIDILHSHSEVITLNPLVTSHKPIKAPRDAPSDEYYSTWYEISERIQYIPGIGKLGSGKINFNGCFHDLEWGLQTHIYAPANVDLRNKYRIGGNQPGIEPPEQLEIGLSALGAPKEGLYLREDIEIKCNFAMVSFVKSQLKASSKEMVNRIIKKAELLDAGILSAMIEDGKLKTINPNDRSYTGGLGAGTATSPPHSPASMYHKSNPPMSPQIPYQIPRPLSLQHRQSYQKQSYHQQQQQQQQQYQQPQYQQQQHPNYQQEQQQPQYQQQQQQQPQYQQQRNSGPKSQGTFSSQKYAGHPFFQSQNQSQKQDETHLQPSELPSSQHGPPASVIELPGDFNHPQSSPHLQPPQPSSSHDSRSGTSSPDPRWSQSQPSPGYPSPGFQHSRPTSYSSENGSVNFASPGLDHKGFASELSTHRETPDEHQAQSPNKQDPWPHSSTQNSGYSYNPADYADMGR